MKHYLEYLAVGLSLMLLCTAVSADNLMCPWYEPPSEFVPTSVQFSCNTVGTATQSIIATEGFAAQTIGDIYSTTGYGSSTLGQGGLVYAKNTTISSASTGVNFNTEKASAVDFGRLVNAEDFLDTECVVNTTAELPYCLSVYGGSNSDISVGQAASNLGLSNAPSISYSSVMDGFGSATGYGGFHTIAAETNESLDYGITENWYQGSTTFYGDLEFAYDFGFGVT